MPVGPGTPRLTVAAAAVYAALKLCGDTLTARRCLTGAHVFEAVSLLVYLSTNTFGTYKRELVDAFEALSEAVQAKATEIIQTSAEAGLLSGKSPTGFAAAAIYAAALLCDEKITQCEVADVAQVTTVTIRNRYQGKIESLDIH